MADDNVSAPVAESERAEKPTDAETVTASEQNGECRCPLSLSPPHLVQALEEPAIVRPSLNMNLENAAATDKPAEAEAEKPASEEAQAEAKAEGEAAEAAPAKAEGEAATAEDAPAEANGTPASAKKSSKNRRSSTGATQKLNRRKSQNRITHLDAKPGQYYMARLRSFAPWPAIICDDEILSESFNESRPVTAMQKDGSYKGEYADGGRRTHERTFPVMFLGSNDL